MNWELTEAQQTFIRASMHSLWTAVDELWTLVPRDEREEVEMYHLDGMGAVDTLRNLVEASGAFRAAVEGKTATPEQQAAAIKELEREWKEIEEFTE
jgi:hypothetical protein